MKSLVTVEHNEVDGKYKQLNTILSQLEKRFGESEG